MKKFFLFVLLVLGTSSFAHAQYWAPYGFYFFQYNTEKNPIDEAQLELAENRGAPLSEDVDAAYSDSETIYYADPDAVYKNRH